MLVEVTLDFFVKFALLSMVERGFYDFGSYVTPTTYYSLAFDNPSLDAQMPPGRKSIAAHWSLRCMDCREGNSAASASEAAGDFGSESCIGMSTYEMWEVTVEDARTCRISDQLHVYHPNGHRKPEQVMVLISERQFVAFNDLLDNEKEAQVAVEVALEHWNDVLTCDTGAILDSPSNAIPNSFALESHSSQDNRYLGTVREEDTLNIFLEFVPGGSISSLLGKFGSFPESVIRTYTKQLLQGLEYLHQNGIIHRDIKGANILVDNKGCIKLADFGASKQVAKLATMNAAKSMKGTPYWMAPEVILQTGHSFSADIWSVGCTVIEMATGCCSVPYWDNKVTSPHTRTSFFRGKGFSFEMFTKGTELETNCIRFAPDKFKVTTLTFMYSFNFQCSIHLFQRNFRICIPFNNLRSCFNPMDEPTNSYEGLKDNGHVSGSCSTMYPEKLSRVKPIWEMSTSNDVCQLDDKDDFPVVGSSFNPMSEPFDEWPCKFDLSPEQGRIDSEDFDGTVNCAASSAGKGENDFTIPSELVSEEEDEVTESKIRAFLDEKALDLKKLQTPLYEEFFNSLSTTNEPCIESTCEENVTNNSKLPPKSKSSPHKVESAGPSLDDCLKLLRGERDEQKLAGLLLATKFCQGNDAASILKVYHAVTPRFLHRLLLTGMGKGTRDVKGGENREAYLRVAVTVLAGFCRVAEIASSEEMISKVPLVAEIISKSSCSMKGPFYYLTIAIHNGYLFLELAGSRSLELAMRLLQLVVNKLSADMMNTENISGISCMVASIAKQFAVLQNVFKFDALHLLTTLLSSNNTLLHDALRSKASKIWAAQIRIGIMTILQNRVVSAEKLQALLLAESMMSIVGENWLLECSKLNENDDQDTLPVDKFLLLVLESSRIEVAVLLNELAYLKYEASKSSSNTAETIAQKQRNLAISFSLIEKIIKLISNVSGAEAALFVYTDFYVVNLVIILS
ncbi:hypothetical protein COCNU_08G005000 [Cocos nucifera]|uniref:Protein kinase domain-containing protein n=1 Tax=Cocos nucifera TaxID=13894 RepID=A0A8K0N699_COCNU|nr:hypothetical protein COCNU_08G005000 [Cocos nucifera]